MTRTSVVSARGSRFDIQRGSTPCAERQIKGFLLAGRRPPRHTSGLIQWLRVGFCGLAFLGFGLGGAVLARLVLPLVGWWPGSSFQSVQRCQRVVRAAWIFFHDYMRWTGLVAFNHRRLELPVKHPSVIISNHPTLIDITALISALGTACFVAKKALFRNPLFGSLLTRCGHIRSLDGADLSGDSAFDQALARLQEGHSVLLFPEGTRSPVDGLGRFRIGAFELARRARVPLVVFSIGAEPRALSKGLPWYAIPPVAMKLSVQHVLTFDAWDAVPDGSALSLLRNDVRQQLLDRLKGPNLGGSRPPDRSLASSLEQV